ALPWDPGDDCRLLGDHELALQWTLACDRAAGLSSTQRGTTRDCLESLRTWRYFAADTDRTTCLELFDAKIAWLEMQLARDLPASAALPVEAKELYRSAKKLHDAFATKQDRAAWPTPEYLLLATRLIREL